MYNKLLKFFVIILTVSLISADSHAEISNEQEYLSFAEEMPSPIDGIESIMSKIKYPSIARQNRIEGKVYIIAFVDETGKATDYKIIKDIGGGCAEAAGRAVLKTKFNPGKVKGSPVKVKLSMSINFKLK